MRSGTHKAGRVRHSLCHAALAVAVAACLPAYDAVAQSAPMGREATISFDIPAGDLVAALDKFSSQSGVQVVYRPELAQGKRNRMISGNLQPSIALARLLEGTGITFERVNDTTFALKAEPPAPSPAQPTPPRASSTEADPVVTELEKMVVVGSHIVGAGSLEPNLISIDRAAIESSGYASLTDVLKALPQNAPGPSVDNDPLLDGGIVGNYGRGSGLNLRGLGIGTTLVLVNGVRQAPSSATGSFVDISMIPLAAVERVDIVTDGASALYGSDAIGGVVNIVLRKDYRGFETAARIGTYGDDATEVRISQIAGTSWTNGRGMIGLEYVRKQALLATDRSYSSDTDQRRNGGDNFSDMFSNPGNIVCTDDSCGWTFEPVYSIPTGQDGTSLTVADLIAVGPPGSGLPEPRYRNGAEGTLFLPEEKLRSVFFDVSQKLTDAIDASFSGRYSTRPIEYDLSQNVATYFEVRPVNPYYVDVFGTGEPIYVMYNLNNELEGFSRFRGETKTLSGTLALDVDLGRDWKARMTASRSSDSLKYDGNSVDFSRVVNEALGNYDDPDTPEYDIDDPSTSYNPIRDGYLNIFGEGANSSEAVLAALRNPAESTPFTSKWKNDVATLVSSGSLFAIAGGAVKAAAGFEFRRVRGNTMRPVGYQLSPRIQLSDTSKAAFAELRVPFVSADNRWTGVYSLDASVAMRYEDTASGNSFDPKVVLAWGVVPSVKLSASYGTSFRAPLLVQRSEDFRDSRYYFDFFDDPLSPGGQSLVMRLEGSNPDLRPEQARSWTAAVDFQPTRYPGLRIRATYFNNRYTDRVGTGGTPGNYYGILNEESLWATIIDRNPTPERLAELCAHDEFIAQQCQFLTPAAVIDLRLQNLALTAVDGVDLLLNHEWETRHGRFLLDLNANYTFKNEFQLARTTEKIDVLDTFGNPLSFRSRLALTWERGPWGAVATVNHQPGYDHPFSGRSLQHRTISSWTTLDLSGIWRASYSTTSMLSGVSVRVSAVNLLNRNPPYANSPFGYDGANADPYGRLLSLEVVKSW